jgi:hypothetical protein
MRDRLFKPWLTLALTLALPAFALSQSAEQNLTLMITGRPGLATVVQMDGRSYIGVEALASLSSGSLSFKGTQIILTLPGPAAVAIPAPSATPPRTSPQGVATTSAAAELRVTGDVTTPLTLTIADLKKMPRKTLSVVNPHDKKTEAYEGVLLEELLRRSGVAQGENLRGTAMATYVAAEGSDGYRVIFSAAELDSGILDSEVIVADTMDGAPIGADIGPLRLVAPHEKRPARWVRMLTTITVVHPRQ